MSTAVLLGIDVGSTRVKAAAFDPQHGRQVAGAAVPTPWRRHGAAAELHAAELHAAELHADDVLAAVWGVVEDALARSGPAGRARVGVTGMAETGFLLDADHRPMAPAPAWFDRRADAALPRVPLDPTGFASSTGLPLTSRCTAVKTHWLTSGHPELRTARHFASVPEWVVFALGGELVSELLLASRTGWLDVVTAEWLPAHLSAVGLDALHLPAPTAAGTPAGRITGGPLAGAVLTVAGHDHVCAAIGAGATAQTDLLDSIGTGEALVRSRAAETDRDEIARAVEAGLTVGRHVTGAQSIFVGLGTGAALTNILTLLGIPPSDIAALDTAALDTAALDTAALQLAPRAVPRPSVDDVTCDEWAQLAGRHTAPEVWRAALETAGRRARAAADTVARFAGPADRVVAVGGWLASEGLRRTKAAALGPLAIPQVGEAAARGAALLAGRAAGQYRTIDEFPAAAYTWVR